MARGKRNENHPDPDAKATVTYKGENETINYLGVTMERGKPVEVYQHLARRLLGNHFFEVVGVEKELPIANSSDSSLDAERAKHRKEMDELKKKHEIELKKASAGILDGWLGKS